MNIKCRDLIDCCSFKIINWLFLAKLLLFFSFLFNFLLVDLERHMHSIVYKLISFFIVKYLNKAGTKGGRLEKQFYILYNFKFIFMPSIKLGDATYLFHRGK